MFVDATHGLKGETTDLVSPSMVFNNAACIEFTIHMFGEYAGSLEIFVRDHASASAPLQRQVKALYTKCLSCNRFTVK